MPKLRVHNITVSIDGYAAGPDQDLEHPLGVRGGELHEWAFATPTYGGSGGSDLDARFAAAGDVGVGATIMGRNMFGPIRGDWGDDKWRGWWGEEPPYHHNTYVLTHHAHDPIPMQGGTTFYFVTDGIESALEQAFAAADGQDVRLGGGASAVQQYLRAGLIDEMHLVFVPILLGSGERIFDHLDGGPTGYECADFVASPAALHTRFVKST